MCLVMVMCMVFKLCFDLLVVCLCFDVYWVVLK